MSQMLVLKLSLLLIVCTTLTAAQEQPIHGAAVLVYHRFDAEQRGSTTVLTKNFESQLDWLSSHRYRIVPLQDITTMVASRRSATDPHLVAITVDDGHRSVYSILFPIIKARHLPVTLFIYPSVISHASYALTWEQLQEMQATGLVRIEAHTLWHPNFKEERKRLSPEQYQALVHDQLTRSRAILEQRLGIPIHVLAWPYGIYDDDLEAAAQQAGYTAAFAYDGKIATPSDPPFAIHRIPVLDHPGIASFPALNQLAQPGHQELP